MEVNSESKRLLREKQFEAKDHLKTLASALSKYVQQKKFDIKVLEQKVNLLDPAKVLARGYTMSYVNGKVVKSAQELKSQEELTTVFKDGSVKSKIIKYE